MDTTGTIRRLLLASLGLGCSVAAAAATPPSAEDIFADARAYTAYIETRIEKPFIEDDQGASMGAGFVIDAERRWLLTNAHVSGRSPAHITARFAGAAPIAARPVYIDPYLDLAILEYEPVERQNSGIARLGCGVAPGTGHPVGAFGHPNGFKFSGTRGVISGRTYRFGADWLQTDAPINGGNSGGPLISLTTGEVIGINTATLNDKQSQNANFAVLAAQACRVVELLKNNADPRPAFLGVSFFREGEEDSLQVAQVFKVGRRAGLRRGDIILGLAEVDEMPSSEGQLIHLLRGRSDAARLRVMRAGQTIDIDASFPPRTAPLDRRGLNLGGALLAVSNQTDIEGLVSAPPVMVHAIAKGSAAELARLKPYDHLIAADGVPIRSLDELEAAVRAQAPDGAVVLEFLRPSGTESSFTLDLLARLPVDDAEAVAFGNAAGPTLSRTR
jgi:S1-C subfamily serine protease